MDKKIPLKLYLFLALITGCSFLPVLRADFLNWDDHKHIYQNESVINFDLRRMFTETVNETYIPLTTLSFAVEKVFFGFNSFIVHLDSLILHIAVAALLMTFFVQIGAPVRAAFLGALLFAIHPMRVESIAWATERKDVLYALFYVMALRQWWAYLDDRKLQGFLLTMLWGGLSLLSKPMAISLPLLLLFMEWFKAGSIRRVRFWPYFPFLVMSAAIGWMTYMHHVRNPFQDAGTVILIWTWSLGFYIWKFFCPVMLYPAYDLPVPVGLFEVPYFASVFLVVGLTAWLWIVAEKHSDKWLLWAAGFFFLSIFFLLRLDVHNPHFVAERFMYLPCAGMCLWLGIRGDEALKRHGRAALAVIAGVFILLGVRTFVYAFVWKDSETLWSYVIKHYPYKELAYNNRAVTYGESGRYSLAIADHTTVLTFPSNRALAFYNRGINYRDWAKERAEAGAQEESQRLYHLAWADFNAAIQEDPKYAKTYYHRGMISHILRDEKGALADLTVAITKDPADAEAYNNRGNVRSAMGDLDLALEDYRQAIDLGIKGPETHNNIGVSYARKGSSGLAVAHFDEAIRLKPGYAEAYFNRSVVLGQQGKFQAALDDALHARGLGLDIDEGYLQSLRERTLSHG